MTPPTEAAMREAFEAWARTHEYFLERDRRPSSSDCYRWTATEDAWTGWQAAQAHARAEMGARMAENANIAVRRYFALMILREFGGMGNGSHGGIISDMRAWIDGGMRDPIPWPTGPFFAKWAEAKGLSNVDGCVGLRFMMQLNRATLAEPQPTGAVP